MKKSFIVLQSILLILVSISSYGQCHYTIDMQDSFGDGWNGASVDVSVNGISSSSFSFSTGYSSSDSIETLNGDVLSFSFTSGNWDTEIDFQIYDPSGIQIYSSLPFNNNSGNDGSLFSDTSNASCFPQFVNVTFQLDMNNNTNVFTSPEINGTWNSYCGDCDTMSDLNGDNIWEKTLSLYTGYYEFIFSADSLTIEETIDPNSSCSNGSFFSTKRFLFVGSQDITLPAVCWESCSVCNGFPQPPSGISCISGSAGLVFTDDCETQGGWTGDFGTGNGIWQVNNGYSATNGTGPYGAHSGTNYFYFESSTWGGGGLSQFDTASIVSPAIDLTSSSDDAELTFWTHGRGASMGMLDVGVSNQPTGPFTDLYTQFGETHNDINDPYTQIGINLSSYIGQIIYVRFKFSRDQSFNQAQYSDLAIDLVEVTSCQTCPTPSLLSSSNITPTSGQLTWIPSGSETQWMIYYNGDSLLTDSIPTTIGGLAPNSNYNCYITAVCSASENSVSSPLTSFTTACSYNVAPTFENFDTGFPACWSQDINDDFDWTLYSGPPPTLANGFSTGPSDDITGGGNYIYTEASNPRNPGDIAIIYSELIDITNISNPELNFYSHMYGADMGTMDIELIEGINSTNIFSLSGDQGDQWVQHSIPFTASSNIIQFKIIGTRGNGWSSDMAIDNFRVQQTVTSDLELLSDLSSSSCSFSAQEQISIKIVNNAPGVQSNFDVSYSVNNGSPVIETFTSNINFEDTIVYNFTTPADLSIDGLYYFQYECILSTDQVPLNNIYSNSIENFVSPQPPTTFNDTICYGDTSVLQASSSNGLINWYTDSLGLNSTPNTAVNPPQTTTYFAQVQSSEYYTDDFENYPTGSLIAQLSNYWTTLSGAGGGSDDAFISGAQMSSGMNSIYLNDINDDNLFLLLNQDVNEGVVEILFDVRVETSSNINILNSTNPSSNEIFNLKLNSGVLEFDIGPTVLTSSCPNNNNWFELKLVGDLNSSIWNIYIDNSFVFGSYIAGANQVGSVNFTTNSGDAYYIDDVEWYIISDDDCKSDFSPLTVFVENCSNLNELKLDESINIYPNPSSDVFNFYSESNVESLKIFNSQGKVISFKNIDDFSGEIDLSYFNKGIYFIEFSNLKSSKFKKIILK